MKFVVSLCLFAITSLCSVAAHAVEVNIATNGFTGDYSINGLSKSGDAVLDLTAGTYDILSGSNTFTINISADGAVTTTNSNSLSVSVGSVSFNTTTVDFIANGFNGKLRGSVTQGNTHVKINDSSSIVVINDATWGLDNGSTGFTFDVDANGIVTSNSPGSVTATGTNSTLELLTANITLEANGYQGHLLGNMFSGNTKDVSDAAGTELVLIRDQKWALGNGINAIGFSVDAAGVVSVVPNSVDRIVATAPDKLELQTASIRLDPNGYEGILRGPMFSGGGGPSNNVGNPVGTDLVLVKDMKWGFGNGIDGFTINVDSAGNVASTGASTSATGDNNTFSLNTTTTTFDFSEFSGSLRGSMIPSAGFTFFDENTELVVINDLNWSLDNGVGSIQYRADSLGNLTSLSPDSLEADLQNIIFKTALVEVDPLGYTGTYGMGGYGFFNGTTEQTMITGLLNQIFLPGFNGKTFTIFDAFASPQIVDLTVDSLGNTTPFQFTVKQLSVPAPNGLLLFVIACLVYMGIGKGGLYYPVRMFPTHLLQGQWLRYSPMPVRGA